jgi:NAD(P)-dependent dehydrogenase (short-subunit alcohol dehydrogenase family)
MAEVEIAAKRFGSAGLNGLHGPQMAHRHPGAVLLPVGRAVRPEDVAEVGHTARSKTSLMILEAAWVAGTVSCV